MKSEPARPDRPDALRALLEALELTPEERAAERDEDLRAVAAAALVAMESPNYDDSESPISRHGTALSARTPGPWAGKPLDIPGTFDAAAWERDGFCLLGRVVGAEALDQLSEAATELIATAFASSGMRDQAAWVARITQIPDPADWVPAFRILEESPLLRAATAAALGVPATRCAWAHLVFKPPGASRPLPWHTDRPTWPLAPGVEGVAVWISVDPLLSSSGGLIYAPGTHRPDAPLPDPVTPTVAAGDALMHHADVLHASGANRSGTWRRAWIGVFVAAESA